VALEFKSESARGSCNCVHAWKRAENGIYLSAATSVFGKTYYVGTAAVVDPSSVRVLVRELILLDGGCRSRAEEIDVHPGGLASTLSEAIAG